MAIHTKTRSAPIVQAQHSRAVAGWLAISFVIPLGALLILAALDVRLGQGYFFFRYSHLRAERTIRALPMIALAGVFCVSVAWLAAQGLAARRWGMAVFCAAILATGAWAWWAPPQPMTQNMFTMTSLSTDGAFFVEARQIKSLPNYLRRFTQRLRLSPADLGGTRILSNPPGATILAYAVRSWFGSSPEHLHWLDRQLIAADGVPPGEAPDVTNPLRFGVALTILWILSGFAAYGLGRVFLAPPGAAVFAIIVTFNPCTVHFVPGKDPAQLLTINLMLWAWFAGWKARRLGSLLCGIAGAVLVLGSTVGLIHLWVALIASAATLWQNRNRMRLLAINLLAAVFGAAMVVALVWLAIGWNIPLSLLAVSRRWNQLQGTFAMNRSIWYVIGLPIFLLFVSPGLWLLLGMAIRRPRLDLGMRLALLTIAAMAIIYIGFGVTYELPRLWVAFIPPLVLGLAIHWPILRAREPFAHCRIVKLLAAIVLAQVVFTSLHWTFFDARETEYRLLSHRFYH